MYKLVFLETNCLDEIPFTTSRVIADNGKVNHDTVKRLIRNYKNDLKKFGVLTLEMRPLDNKQLEWIYKLNEQQSALLITYMKNTLHVKKLKKLLVKQFYIMQKKLIKRTPTRTIVKEIERCIN